MQATRREILDITKRQAGATVDELARALKLSPMCIRQHLALLERDGLVSPREVRRRTGRPHFFYTLTEKSDEHFPKSYDKLASAMLDGLKNSDGPERVSTLLRSLGGQLGAQYARQLAGQTLEERLATMVGVLTDGSGSSLGEWQADGGGYVLREFDCPYRKVAVQHPEVCELHLEVLRRGLDAEVELLENQARGDVRCTYQLRPRAADGEHKPRS